MMIWFAESSWIFYNRRAKELQVGVGIGVGIGMEQECGIHTLTYYWSSV